MGLSNDLVSQFVKITKDQTVEKRESIVYGTIVEYNSKMYVKIDGSDLITPVETTTDMQSGERVTVLIKDHTATVTGNITSPAPSSSTVTKKVQETVDGFKQTVSKTYATKDEYNNLANDLHTNYSTSGTMSSMIEQKATSILSTVSSTYATTDELTGEVTNINNSISEVRQESNKISWLIKSGTSSSNMVLTDSALSIIANNINLTGKVTFSCLDNSTQNTINTANSNASSAKSTLDNNSSDWTNAYNRVVEWASGDVTGSTTINGGLIQTGTVTADKIQGRELIGITLRNSTNTFSVDGDGNIVGANISGDSFLGDILSINGEISANTLTVQTINSPNYPATLSESITIYVDENYGSDDVDLDDAVVFQTMDGLFDKLPRFLNGYTVNIVLNSSIHENIEFNGFAGGRIRMYFQGNVVYGYIRMWMSSAKLYLYGGEIGQSVTDMAYGTVHPNTGVSIASRTVSVGAQDNSTITLYKMNVYGSDNNYGSNTVKVGVACDSFATSYISDTAYKNCDICARANAGGRIHDNSSSGVGSKYGFESVTGAVISIVKNAHAGGITASYNKSNTGQIWVDSGATFASGSQTTGSTGATTTTTKTITYTSTSGDTYRSTVYNNWKKDGTVRQGDYGYGDCNGCWFFGSQLAAVKGKNITKVQITITRQTGGSSSAVNLSIKTHNYSSRPTGAPSYVSSVGTLSIATGNSGTLTITNTSNALITGLKNGTVKGIGLQSSYTSALYAVCSGTCKIKITYTE